MISKKHLQQNETICAIFKEGLPKIDGGPKKKGTQSNCLIRLTQYPPLVYGEESYKSSQPHQKMPGLETNFKSTGPRPDHYEAKTKTASKRPRPRP